MDLGRTKDADKLAICRKYFIGGFFLLPWMWLVNSVWFFNEARKPNANPAIRRMVILSALGALLWAIGLAVWATIYQDKRASWGALGDQLTFYSPKGVA